MVPRHRPCLGAAGTRARRMAITATGARAFASATPGRVGGSRGSEGTCARSQPSVVKDVKSPDEAVLSTLSTRPVDRWEAFFAASLKNRPFFGGYVAMDPTTTRRVHTGNYGERCPQPLRPICPPRYRPYSVACIPPPAYRLQRHGRRHARAWAHALKQQGMQRRERLGWQRTVQGSPGVVVAPNAVALCAGNP